MHDVDRPTTAFEAGVGAFEAEGPYSGETEFNFESEGVFNEVQEMELAANMLEVTNEAELEQFLGDLIKKAGGAIGKIIRSPTGQAIGGLLRTAAREALPIIGTAAGTALGGPLGGSVGGGLAQTLGQAFGLELEGLSPQDQEYEVARQFVKFAGDTVRRTVEQGGVAPAVAAQNAAIEAARQHAPGLVSVVVGPGGNGTATIPARYSIAGTPAGNAGQWVRRGNHIVLYGV
jgi:hypothetical protein